MSNEKTVEVECVINGTSVRVRRSVAAEENVQGVIKDLLADMGMTKQEQVISQASVAAVMESEISPMPQMQSDIAENPYLENAPHTYKAGDAAVELLNPAKSKWAASPRTVKEIQERLMSLGIRGVSNIQNFDWVLRSLNNQGKVRREKIDGVYKYYAVQA